MSICNNIENNNILIAAFCLVKFEATTLQHFTTLHSMCTMNDVNNYLCRVVVCLSHIVEGKCKHFKYLLHR